MEAVTDDAPQAEPTAVTGEIVRSTRTARRQSRRVVAELSGLTEGKVWSIENGRTVTDNEAAGLRRWLGSEAVAAATAPLPVASPPASTEPPAATAAYDSPDARVVDVPLPDVLETTTGPIRFALAVARGASIELETHSGAIDIQLARKADVELDAETVTGTIDNSWSRARPAAGREGRGMTLAASAGPSSGRIVVRSFKGRISLHGS